MLPYYAYRLAEAVVRVAPHRFSYWLGDRCADALLLAVPSRFDPLRDNLRHVMPDADDTTFQRTVRRNLRNLTHSWIDVMEMSGGRVDLPSRLDITGLHYFTEAVARGRGVVVASCHYGSWEVGLAGWNAMGGRLALLAEVLQPQQLFERVIGSRGKQRVHVIPIDIAAMRDGGSHEARRIGAAAMREVFRFLRSGGAVAIALDRDLIGNGVPVQFFGEPAPIPVGAIEIALRAGAAIVPVLLRRNHGRVDAMAFPEVPYDADADRDAELQRVTREVLRIFEDEIRRHPEQWHVTDRIWPGGKAG